MKTTKNTGTEKHPKSRKKDVLDRIITDKSKAIRKNPKDADAYLKRGLAYRKKGKIKEAIADFNEAIRLNPFDACVYLIRGTVHTRMGKVDLGAADLSMAIGLNPEMKNIYRNCFKACCMELTPDLTTKDCPRKIRQDSTTEHSNNSLDYSYLTREIHAEILRMYKGSSALWAFPGESIIDKIQNITMANLDWSLTAAEGELLQNAYDPSALTFRGTVRLLNGDNFMAKNDFDMVIHLFPYYPDAYISRGIMHFNIGRLDLAIADFGKAIHLNPIDDTVHLFQHMIINEKCEKSLS